MSQLLVHGRAGLCDVPLCEAAHVGQAAATAADSGWQNTQCVMNMTSFYGGPGCRYTCGGDSQIVTSGRGTLHPQRDISNDQSRQGKHTAPEFAAWLDCLAWASQTYVLACHMTHAGHADGWLLAGSAVAANTLQNDDVARARHIPHDGATAWQCGTGMQQQPG
jgi:hypothetical protein